MKHPCAGCKAKATKGRVTCPILWTEITLKECDEISGEEPKQALQYFKSQKKVVE